MSRAAGAALAAALVASTGAMVARILVRVPALLARSFGVGRDAGQRA